MPSQPPLPSTSRELNRKKQERGKKKKEKEKVSQRKGKKSVPEARTKKKVTENQSPETPRQVHHPFAPFKHRDPRGNRIEAARCDDPSHPPPCRCLAPLHPRLFPLPMIVTKPSSPPRPIKIQEKNGQKNQKNKPSESRGQSCSPVNCSPDRRKKKPKKTDTLPCNVKTKKSLSQ